MAESETYVGQDVPTSLGRKPARGQRETRRFTRSRKMRAVAAAVVVLGFGVAVAWVGSNAFPHRATSSVTDLAVRKVVLTGSDSTVPMALLLAGPKDAMVMPMNLPSVASNAHHVVRGVPSATGAKPVPLGGVAASGGGHGTLSVSAAGTPAPASFTIFCGLRGTHRGRSSLADDDRGDWSRLGVTRYSRLAC